METRSRIYESLDLWRGFAAIWVVLFHSIVGINMETHLERNPFVAFCLWGDTAVPIFFVISGYCMAAAAANLIDRNQTIGRFSIARIRRIYPPHLVALVLGIGVAGLYLPMHKLGLIKDTATIEWFTHLSAWQIAVNALLLQVPFHERSLNDVTWTLSYEVAFYAVIGLAIAASRKQGWQWMLKLLHLVTIISFAVTIFAPHRAFFPFDQWIGFGEGVLLFDLLCGPAWKERSGKAKLFYGALIVTITALLITNIVYDKTPVDYNRSSPQSWRLLITSGFAVLFYYLRPLDMRIKNTKWVSGLFFIGTFSYSLYLIHFMLLSILHRVFAKLHVSPRLFALEMMIELAICIAIAYVFYRLVESRFMSAKSKPVTLRQPSTTTQIITERV